MLLYGKVLMPLLILSVQKRSVIVNSVSLLMILEKMFILYCSTLAQLRKSSNASFQLQGIIEICTNETNRSLIELQNNEWSFHTKKHMNDLNLKLRVGIQFLPGQFPGGQVYKIFRYVVSCKLVCYLSSLLILILQSK